MIAKHTLPSKRKDAKRNRENSPVKAHVKNCSYCGRANSDEATHCTECGTEFSTETTEVVSTTENKSPSAGFWIRALARIADAIFGIFVGFLGGTLAGIMIRALSMMNMVRPGWQYRLHRFSLASVLFALMGSIAYHFFCEGIHGATLGKFLCGIRVVSEGEKPPTLRGAFLRTIAFYIDAIFFGIIGYTSMMKSPLNQRYGDLWAKTVVVKVSELPPEQEKTTQTHFLIGLVAGLACWVTLLAIGMLIKLM